MHGLFSIGAAIGAVVGDGRWQLVLRPDASDRRRLPDWVSLSLAAARGCCRRKPTPKPRNPVLPDRPAAAAGIGGLAFICLLAEGAVCDWSAVYLRFVLGAEPGIAAGGFAAFALLMAVGRLTGDSPTGQFGSGDPVAPERFVVPLGFESRPLGHGTRSISSPVSGWWNWAWPMWFPVFVSARFADSQRWRPAWVTSRRSPRPAMRFLGGPPLIGFAAEAITLTGRWRWSPR